MTTQSHRARLERLSHAVPPAEAEDCGPDGAKRLLDLLDFLHGVSLKYTPAHAPKWADLADRLRPHVEANIYEQQLDWACDDVIGQFQEWRRRMEHDIHAEPPRWLEMYLGKLSAVLGGASAADDVWQRDGPAAVERDNAGGGIECGDLFGGRP